MREGGRRPCRIERTLVLLAALLPAVLFALPTKAAEPLWVSVAISVRPAVDELARLHEERTGIETRVHAAASGLLLQQIDNAWINVAKGAILVFGVLLSQLVVRRR